MADRKGTQFIGNRQQFPQIATIEEITERHRGKWVLMKVTECDESGWPMRGQVIAVDRSRKRISQTYLAETQNPSPEFEPHVPYYVFQAEPLCTNSTEWRQALARVSDQDTTDASD